MTVEDQICSFLKIDEAEICPRKINPKTAIAIVHPIIIPVRLGPGFKATSALISDLLRLAKNFNSAI